MKKLLLTASLLATSVMASFAQAPDASSWTKGQEITDKIGWGNLSFENPTNNDVMDYWKLTSGSGSFTKTGGLFEVYDGSDVDLFQYVELPAGMYRVECQGYYRYGQSWDQDPAAFNTADWKDNALLYVQNGTYDITSDEFAAGRTFKTPLMPRLYDYQASQIYVGPKDGEDGYPGWDMSDGDYGEKGWGPCSVPGSLAWFNAGKYQPVDDGDVKYNTVTFFLTETGYARIGVTKKDPKSADSFMVTNFKMYYEGEVDPETAELVAMQEDIAEYYHLIDDISYADQVTLYGPMVANELFAFEDDFGSIDNLSKEECEKALPAIKALYERVVKAGQYKELLQGLVEKMSALNASTDYPGKAAFTAAIKEANDLFDINHVIAEGETIDLFETYYNNLASARTEYIMSQEPVDGAYDFTSAINAPWFCNPEYEPTWDAENNVWVANQAALDAGWSEYDDIDGTDVGKESPAATPIADKVTLSSNKDVVGQWFQVNNGMVIYWNDNLSCVKKWDMPHSDPDDYARDVTQRIVNIPNGYYKLKALAQTWSNDWSDDSPCKNRIYIKSGDAYSESEYLQPGGWWGKDINQWIELETGLIQVTDGEVIISSRDNGFAAFTGFRLYYYGETPDFTALVKPELEAAQAKAEALSFAGDKKAVEALFAEIPETIEGNEQFQAALATIEKANSYISAANAAIAAFETTINNFNELLTAQEAGSAESSILATAVDNVFALGEKDTDTYLSAIAAGKDYQAYKDYLDYRVGLGELAKNEAVAAVISEQNIYLAANYADAAKIAELTAAIAAPYNKALLASLGMDKASIENPVDVTVLITNPNFNELSKGWNGEMTVDTLYTPERWNTTFNISQTVYSLPAGCYRVDVQAYYRDGSAQDAYNNWIYTAFESEDEWTTGNAIFFANENEVKVKSIASSLFKEMSYTDFVESWVVAEEADEHGNDIWVPKWKSWETDLTDEGENKYGNPWDVKIEDVDEVYYVVDALRGAARRFEKNPEAFHNEVYTLVEEGGSITFGLKKDVTISNDWCAFDNFRLYYVGAEAPSAVQTVGAGAARATEVYSLSGARLSGVQKGINIVKYSDGTVKKVLVK